MKKRVLLLVLAVLALTFVLVSCGKHEHDFKQTEVITEATCDAAGKAKFACECGETEEREIAAKGHTFGEEQVKEATCWENGYTYKVCTVCNAESEHTNEVKADPKYHVFNEVKETKPDCSTQTKGTKKTVCSICGADDGNGVEETMWEHDYKEIVVEATCQAPGSKYQQCQNEKCGVTTTPEEIPQLSHQKEQVGDAHEATCTEAGYISYKCTVCGEEWNEENGEALGHKWAEEQSFSEATCTERPYYYYDCENCDEIQFVNYAGDADGHIIIDDENDPKYATRNNIIPATCINPGSITPICDRCEEVLDTETDEYGASYVTILPATGNHFVTEKEIGTYPATCHKAQYTEYQCTVDEGCEEKRQDEVGDPVPHKYGDTPDYTEPSKCNFQGHDFYYCTECPDGNSCEICLKKVEIEKPSHDELGGSKPRVEATCCELSYQKFICSMCEQEWTKTYTNEEYPMKDHGAWESTGTVVAPTCSTEGYTVYLCKNDPNCEVTDNQTFTRRVEHSFTEYVDGRLVCSGCKVTYRDKSTFLADPIISKDLEIDADTKLTCQLIGYKAPAAPETVGEGYTYVIGEESPNVSNGLILLSGSATKVVVKYVDADGKEQSADITAFAINVTIAGNSYVCYDLYADSKVEGAYLSGKLVSVEITADAATTVRLFTNEG